MNRTASLVAAALSGCLLASQAAHAQIDTIVNTLTACEPGGGIGAQIGNVGAQDTPNDVGFRFTVPPGTGGTITDLIVCVSTSDAAYDAPFALFTDVGGAPGVAIDSFDVSIPEERGYSSTLADVGALLRPGRSYWIVAERSVERGTWWRAFPDVLGSRAGLQGDATEWEVTPDALLSQMRVRALPEPASTAGAAAAVAVIAALRRARRRAAYR